MVSTKRNAVADPVRQRGRPKDLSCLRNKYILLLLVMAVSFGVYSNTLSHEFVWDDQYEILQNVWIRNLESIPNMFVSHSLAWLPTEKATMQYYPLKLVVRILQYRLFETAPMGYHLTNVLLHVSSTAVFFLVVVSFFKHIYREKALFFPVIASLLFAIHPVHAEPVNWVSSLHELCMSLFCLLSFFVYIRAPEGKKYNKVLSSLFFFIAIFFKSSALFFPLVFLGYDYCLRRGAFAPDLKGVAAFKEAIRCYVPFACSLIGYLVLFRLAVGGEAVVPKEGFIKLDIFDWAVNIPPLLMKYFELLLFPSDLNALYVFHAVTSFTSVQFLFSALVSAGFAAVVIMAWRKNSGLFLSLLWIIVTLIPPLCLPTTGYSYYILAERYLYLPSAGFAIAITIAVRGAYRGRILKKFTAPVVVVSAFVITTVLALLTFQRNDVWEDDYSLWSDTVQKSPDSSIAHSNLGVAYQNKRLCGEALKEYDRALALSPSNWDAFVNRQKLLRYERQ
ncbi:MAG: tetratricopeptide repeat protein [Thermodesulfovibrionales bacterium]|jgi:tetratricopeptide (TPR) repeat protein